jgi:HTH-type transcriptional regulator/antitoxin HigA
LGKLEAEVCGFLGIKSIDEEPAGKFAARKADAYGHWTPGQIAWLCRCRQLAQKQKPAGQFNVNTFRDVAQTLPREYANEKTLQQVPERLARLGVALVLLEHLPGTKIDGAAFWEEAKPVVAVSIRFDRVDSFWHTLMHELAHLVLHGQSFTSLDVDIVGPGAEGSDKPRSEQEADRQACEWLVPPHELAGFVKATKPFYSHQKIVQFAERLGVHPGIVVGQLQFRGEIGWGHSRQFLVKVRNYLPLES